MNVSIYKLENDYFNYIIDPDRIIHFNQFTVDNKLDSIIYDLIKTNIVEKVEDDNKC